VLLSTATANPDIFSRSYTSTDALVNPVIFVEKPSNKFSKHSRQRIISHIPSAEYRNNGDDILDIAT